MPNGTGICGPWLLNERSRFRRRFSDDGRRPHLGRGGLATTALTRAALRRGETTPASRYGPSFPVVGFATSHVIQRAQAQLTHAERSALAA